jgi:hypothetical protein
MEPLLLPRRCVHCAAPSPHAWAAWHQQWEECADCRLWQAYLWQQRPPALVTDPSLVDAITDAIAEGNLPGENA